MTVERRSHSAKMHRRRLESGDDLNTRRSCSSRTDRAVTAATIGVPLASIVTRDNAPAEMISTMRPRN